MLHEKQVAQASQSRGVEVLIRKYQSKKADANRKSVQRQPLAPN